jgi:DHA2 family multidrug resistance protein
LQLLLDRGAENDWFNSTETWVEAIVFGLSFAYFIVHTAYSPAGKSFFNYQLLKNSNFVSGLLFIFIVGAVLYATRALTPPMLQTLMGYPVATTGLVTAPSGVGTMAAMLIVGRLIGKVDLRLLLLTGFLIAAFSLWQMMHYTLVLGMSDIVWPGLVQGVGLGLIFVPLSAASFATLAPAMRAEGTAIYSLVRNIGSSIGISLVQTLLVRNTQVVHASLGEQLSNANPALQDVAVRAAYNLDLGSGASVLNAELTRQASMIAYLDDFKLMLILTLAVIPLLLLIRPPGRGKKLEVDHAVAD